MRKLFILAIIISCLVSSCATVPVATDMGIKIGESFQAAAAKGEVSAPELIKAWDFTHGIIETLMGASYEHVVTPEATTIMADLDWLAAKKEPLTNREKGDILGHFCRLEAIAIEQTWSRFGISIFKMMTSL